MVNAGAMLGTPVYRSAVPDSLRDNDTEYRYRILAFDYFHSRPSVFGPIVGHGVEPARIPAPFIDSLYEVPDSTVVLRWSLDPAAPGSEGEMASIQVFHSRQPRSGYRPVSKVLPPHTRDFQEQVGEAGLHYYKVVAVDAAGRAVSSTPRSFMLIDSMPPAPPTGLELEVDREGIVNLTWAPNTEDDLSGYRVFFTHGRGAALQRRNGGRPLKINTFTDTLNLGVLQDSAFYHLAAIDYRDNVSALSRIYAVALPDVHVPNPPVLIHAVGDTTGVFIEFAPSDSPDAVKYIWQRRVRGTDAFLAFAEQDSASAKTGQFVDATGLEGMTYEYRLEVRDEVEQRSLSNILPGTHLLRPVLPSVERLSAKRDPETNVLQLTWQYDLDRRLARFRIVRAAGDLAFETLSLLDIDQISRKGPNRKDGSYLWRVEDKTANLGTEYRYGIQAESADGRVSKIVEL